MSIEEDLAALIEWLPFQEQIDACLAEAEEQERAERIQAALSARAAAHPDGFAGVLAEDGARR